MPVNADFEVADLLDSADAALYDVTTHGPGPEGKLPLTDEFLRRRPSGDAFGMSMDAGMGWKPDRLAGPQFVMLSTMGGLRADDGRPIALGYHTGHFELGLGMRAAAEAFKAAGAVPYAGHCSDPCDGRTQGTPGMFDSLAYRNDAAIIFRRLARSIPTAKGILGVATCDPPACPVDPHGQGHPRRGHLRQGAAGHDDGVGELPGVAVRARARRGDAAAYAG